MQFNHSVPEKWYQNVYSDKKECRSSARSFSLLHENKTDECWLLIHGYRGYPGELVRPAEDLFNLGFDIFVPRLPGNGTSGNDFIKSTGKDWLNLAQNALKDLSGQYTKVNLLGHSMGSSIAAIIGCNNPQVGKIILVSPSFKNLQMPFHLRIILKAASLVTPRLNAPGIQTQNKGCIMKMPLAIMIITEMNTGNTILQSNSDTITVSEQNL